nr:AAA family ATPase [Pseudomonadota bacterium]
ALAGPILEELLNFLRAEACVEVRGSNGGSGLRYALTDRGRAAALDALLRGGYVGPAPVPLEDYSRVVQAQSVHHCVITKDILHDAFAGVVVPEALLDQLGPALHSGRAIFVYGPAGTGKTYISRRLALLVGDVVLIPHAIAVGDIVIQFFDPVVHRPVSADDAGPGLLLEQGFDPRFIRCYRPAVVTGGELTLDMLELHYDPATRQYQAPIQLKANNGTFMVDDLGRQKAATADLLNRWIVPMEERRDFLSVGAGRHFPVPFDMVLLFSTNINPLDLADEAFLRRIGYKVRFDYLTADAYAAIWRQVCREQHIECRPEVLPYVLDELHGGQRVPLLPCHPRDLLGLAVDRCRYLGEPPLVGIEAIRWAWRNYFIRLNED